MSLAHKRQHLWLTNHLAFFINTINMYVSPYCLHLCCAQMNSMNNSKLRHNDTRHFLPWPFRMYESYWNNTKLCLEFQRANETEPNLNALNIIAEWKIRISHRAWCMHTASSSSARSSRRKSVVDVWGSVSRAAEISQSKKKQEKFSFPTDLLLFHFSLAVVWIAFSQSTRKSVERRFMWNKLRSNWVRNLSLRLVYFWHFVVFTTELFLWKASSDEQRPHVHCAARHRKKKVCEKCK